MSTTIMTCPLCGKTSGMHLKDYPCDACAHGSAAAPCCALRVLRLTLKKKWFDMIASGEKTEEYRTPSAWIFSRLIGKCYDVVEFSNGYGKHVPKIVVKFCGWHQGPGRPEWGATWQTRYVVIRLGHIISRHNSELNP